MDDDTVLKLDGLPGGRPSPEGGSQGSTHRRRLTFWLFKTLWSALAKCWDKIKPGRPGPGAHPSTHGFPPPPPPQRPPFTVIEVPPPSFPTPVLPPPPPGLICTCSLVGNQGGQSTTVDKPTFHTSPGMLTQVPASTSSVDAQPTTRPPPVEGSGEKGISVTDGQSRRDLDFDDGEGSTDIISPPPPPGMWSIDLDNFLSSFFRFRLPGMGPRRKQAPPRRRINELWVPRRMQVTDRPAVR